MFILIWRGWGLLALVALLPFLGSIVALLDLDTKWPAFLAMLLSLILSRAGCIAGGMRLNRPQYAHDLYFIPLQVWGWAYLIVGGLMAALFAIGAVSNKLSHDRIAMLVRGLVGLVVAVAAAFGAVRWAGPWRSAPDSDSWMTDGERVEPFEDRRTGPRSSTK